MARPTSIHARRRCTPFLRHAATTSLASPEPVRSSGNGEEQATAMVCEENAESAQKQSETMEEAIEREKARLAAAEKKKQLEDDGEEAVDEEAEAKWAPIWIEVRELFKKPEVAPAAELDLKWTEPDEEGLVKFLVERMQFSEERVMSGIKRLKAAKGKASQQRMDSFFTISGTSQSTFKRKVEEKKPAGKGKGKKGKFGRK